jgi:hypothetical protein
MIKVRITVHKTDGTKTHAVSEMTPEAYAAIATSRQFAPKNGRLTIKKVKETR